MKNKYILFILLLVLLLGLPSGVKASKSCVYVGKTSSTIIRASASDRTNDARVTINVDDISGSITVVGYNNVANNYSIFKVKCPEYIYICWPPNSIGNSYGVFAYNDYQSCSLYTNLVLENSASYSGNGSGYEPTEHLNCRYLFGDPDDSKYIAYWLQWTINLMKYLGIIALFVMSTVDFVKALVQHDQDALKKAATTSVKRFIFCVLLFFLPIIVDTLMSFLGAYGTCNIG